MIAPSPDWFVGFDTVSMCNQATGEWRDEFMLPVAPVFDAGTDVGRSFESDDSDSDLPMSVLHCDGKAFCDPNEDDFLNLVALGKFTFTQVDENDMKVRLRNKLAAWKRKFEKKQAEKEAALEPAMDM